VSNQSFPHGGNVRALAAASGRDPSDILDASASLNPLGPPPWLRDVLSAAVSDLVHYPDPEATALIAAAVARYGAPASHFVAGNGTSELLFALPRCTGLARAVIPSPAYTDYGVACHKAGMDVRRLPGSELDGFALHIDRIEAVLRSPSMVVIASPANPTGALADAAAIVDMAGRHPQSLFVVDEAFADFVPDFTSLAGERPHNVAVLLSLTKSFAVPGLRLGLLAASPDLADWVRRTLPPWSVNAMAQAVGARALADADFLETTRRALPPLRDKLAAGLAGLGLTVFPGAANFLLARLAMTGPNAPEVCRRMLAEHGVALRDCTNFSGLSDRYLRIAVRPEAETGRILDGLATVLAACPMPASRPKKRRAPALMLQGTASNAGKSVLTAGLCRLLARAGYNVAPFKSQNMSLNSGVTADGLEMGRAQIVQARACRLAPDARMNPILLKPTSDLGSQVIVLGKPVGTMRVGEYIQYKPTAFAAAKDAYDALAAAADVMVIEGAGSPAEVNLKAHDIVNMAMARHAGARVLLAADIDRGGAYAGLLGTMECLPEDERAFVAGYVLNRFRGDATLLAPANAFLRERTGRDVLGVVPYLPDLGLPEEDSVTFKDGGALPETPPTEAGFLDIAVIDLPHVSNFTDLDAFAAEADVRVRRATTAARLGRPDAVIIPGSKNTLADLAWLRKSGLAAEIAALAATGKTEVVGICAGLQMLGETVADPLGLESGRGEAAGLGLLPLATSLAADKTLALTNAVHESTGLPLRGYEIHHGVTTPRDGLAVAVRREGGDPMGYARSDAPVWGAYLHGIFDADGYRRAFCDGLRRRRGLEPMTRLTAYDIEPALDRLADVIEASLGLATVRRLLEL